MLSSKKIGNGFEREFKTLTERSGWTTTRIPDGSKRVTGGRLVPQKSPFDFMLSKQDRLSVYCDAKTTMSDRFSYSAISESGQNQVSELLRIEANGHIAGFVIEFRQTKQICFASASQLANLNPRESLKPSQLVNLGENIEMDRLFK